VRDVTPVADRNSGKDASHRAAQDAADASLLRDRTIAAFGDHYLVGKEVGRGGMAVVYAATDIRLQRTVALKVLPPDLAFRSDVRERFVREAQTAARLNHPHIVPIYSVHEAQGLVCFSMALVTGESLAARITRESKPSFEYVATVLEQTADALAYAHASGVVHRDIKPDNILLDAESGRVMVTDFGIARAAGSGSRLTQTGIAVGTPAFMSPEQATGDREIDGRSDVYSLGVVGYLMLAGRLPFDAATTPAMLVKHLSETPPPLWTVRPEAPRVLASILDRCLAKRPDDRWENAMAMRDALRGALRSGFSGGAGSGVALGAARAAIARRRESVERSRDTMRDRVQEEAQRVRESARESARRFGHHHADWAPNPVPSPYGNQDDEGARQPLDRGADQRPAMSPLPAIPPLPATASRREVKEWQRSVREQRAEQKQRWKIEREAQRDAISFENGSRSPEERGMRFRHKLLINVGVMGMLGVINANTGGFPWIIFPVFGMSVGLLGDYTKLRARGMTWGQIFGRQRTSVDAPIPTLPPKPQRIAKAVRAFKRHLNWFGGSAAVATCSFVIGGATGADPMVIPFVGALSVGALSVGALSAGLAMRDWLRLRDLGVSGSEALGDGWHGKVAAADDRPREVRIRDEIARIASASVLASRFGETVRGAVEDRITIRETSERLSDADRSLVPDVEPTADALLERIGSLAGGLERLEADLPGNALPQLDARIAALDAEPENAPDRERRHGLLMRQRASLADLDERRATMQRQLESASLALRSLRLDMVKLRTLGVGAAINDVTNATQEARALSRDIGRAVEAADEVRRL
jgi:serine/threonine-protein kinase